MENVSASGKENIPAPEAKNPGPAQEERYFLEGPRSRFEEFKFTLEVMFEFIKGFRAFHYVGPCVTVFGSARTPDQHKFYELSMEIGKRLAQSGFTVMTGGGPGIMKLLTGAQGKPAELLSDATLNLNLNRIRILTWING